MRCAVVRRALAILVGLLIVGLPTSLLRAGDDKADPRVYDVGAKVEGKTYAEWSAIWSQWAVSIKKDRNPVLDKTGEFAGEGQQGPVWFLAGNVGGKTTRKCVVPAGKPLFFPVINYAESAPPDKADDKKLVAAAKAAMDREVELEAALDGEPIARLARFRVASDAFTVAGPDRAADAAFEDIVGKQKVASNGYFLMLKALSPGKHTLHFRGKVKAEKGKEPFEEDVTYELTVEEKK